MDTITISKEELEKQIKERLEVEIRTLGLDKAMKTDKVNSEEKDKNEEAKQNVVKFFSALVRNDLVEAKALSEGTDADGGFLVPTEFSTRIIEKLKTESQIRKYATVLPMSVDKVTVPADLAAVTVYWKAENAALTESNPTFANVTLDTNKLTGLSKMSRELFADAKVSVIDLLVRVFTNAFRKEEDKVFMVGTGSGQPTGIRTYTLTSVAQAGANLVANDIEGLYFTLPADYRDNAVWIINGGKVPLINNLRATGGEKLYDELVKSGTVLGRPVIENPNIPTNLGAGTNETEIYFGDLSYYLIGDREQIATETTTVGAGAFETHQVAFKMWERIDGKLGLTDAFVKMTGVK